MGFALMRYTGRVPPCLGRLRDNLLSSVRLNSQDYIPKEVLAEFMAKTGDQMAKVQVGP
jgi:hypothetical protein